MGNLTTIGIDIAKNFMQLHGVDNRGKIVLKKRVARGNFLKFMANLPRCLIGMEACSGAHYWSEELTKLGYTVKLMSPNKVKKYVDYHKNDARDAAACCEAVGRPPMPFVPVKTQAQRSIQARHRVRSYYVKKRTSLMNMMRGLLLENGIAIRQGKAALVRQLRELLDPDNPGLCEKDKQLFEGLYEDLKELDIKIAVYTRELTCLAQEETTCQRLLSLPGVGPLTATAMVAKIGNGSDFKKGRELSAYLGLVPKQHSSGEKNRLLGISKHGDRYLRQLLIHGGRSAVQAALRKKKKSGLFEKQDAHSRWMRQLVARVGMNKASVALANKNARMIVALMKTQTDFQVALAHG